MRDLLLLAILAPGLVATLSRPFVGALLWAWVGIMNPHRLCYGFMVEAPVAQVIAVCMLIGMLRSDQKRNPIIAAPVKWLVAFVLWMCLTTATAFDPGSSLVQLEKVFKIDLMLVLSLAVVRSRREIIALAWVIALSLAFYGVKGGLFTLASGGGARVFGPPGSYIEENNALAAALVVVVPLMRFLQTLLAGHWQRVAMTGAMLLCGVSILGSQSRGALLAITTMVAVLWIRGRNKFLTAILVVTAAAAALSFMPNEWWARMHTIETYESDQSAMGRIGAWNMAFALAKDRLVGGGFSIWNEAMYARYYPQAPLVVTAHSIYFHVIGEHGFIGLFLYLGMGLSTWFSAGWLRKHGAEDPKTQWSATLGAMVQVSLAGFAVGGAFLSLTYYDLPYNLLALTAAARWWVQSGAWRDEPQAPTVRRFLGIPLFLGDDLPAYERRKVVSQRPAGGRPGRR